MALLSRLSNTTLAFVALFILVLGKDVAKQEEPAKVICQENGRFYRNPERSNSTTWTAEECAKYYLCVQKDVFEFRCTSGLMFDVSRQVCDEPENVHNCDITAETQTPIKPLLEAALCSNDTHLGCGNGDCIPVSYFCDGYADCSDGSDEGWCDNENGPFSFKADPCDVSRCLLPSCFCSHNGTESPASLVLSQTPQMILLTFNGRVNHENWDIFHKHLFTSDKVNPNGCPIKGTFFVTHSYTNYRHVQKLWNDGHEIAVNSITNRRPVAWWTKNATVEEWFDETIGQANIINAFANVRMEDFRGLRAPYLAVGGNRQFLTMHEFGFVYDASIVAPVSNPPYWPYTFDFLMPHECLGNNQHCPKRSYAGIWEMVINPLTHGNQTCPTLDRCPTKLSGDEVYTTLLSNFKRHYLTNRAPFGIHLEATWLKNMDYLAAIKKFINEIRKLPDVYFVTETEAIEWMKRPTPVLQLPTFRPWHCMHKAFSQFEVACSKPNTCKLPSKALGQRYMITCNACPNSYPWIRNEHGID